MSASTAQRYLEGNFAPVEEEVTAFDLPVTGRLPAALDGRYLRNGPNPIGPVDPRAHHWFVGTGMVHGIRLRDGRAEWYRNRYVRGDEVAERQQREPLGGRVPGMFAGSSPNTNVIGHAGATWAIVEAGGQPVELGDDLESLRYVDFDGHWPGAFSAHPKRDPDTGDLHVVVYNPEWDGVRYVVVDAAGAVRSVVHVDVPGKTMVHDTAITASSVILFDLPVTFSVDALMEGHRFPYRWDPGYTPRIGVLPRDGTAADVRWCEVGSCYVYHPLNAHDLPDGRIVLDVARHPKMFDTDVHGPWEGPPTLDRWVIDPGSGVVKEERLDDRGQEFPRVDERLVGKPHRIGWCASFGPSPDGGPQHGGILKHDLARGTTEVHDLGLGRSSGEAVFVPRDADAGEDEGWVMSLVYDRGSDTSELVLLDAQDITAPPVARVHLPQRVPYGFHGNWVATA